MRLYPDAKIKVEEDRMEPGSWNVFVGNQPFNTWLNVPCAFSTREDAERVADAIRQAVPR